MVKVSPSREITTPWNFIFDPFGTDRRLTFCLFDVWLVETWAETSGAIAITRPKPHIRVSGRNLVIALMLIIISFNIGRNPRHSGVFLRLFGERISPVSTQGKRNRRFFPNLS